ncbi:MAG: alpha/beta hydrolase [Candidatus Omnitrophica bacterium]|nr:alpha/beta hydrolase [Candidatus Omnitrophota bacterium]
MIIRKMIKILPGVALFIIFLFFYARILERKALYYPSKEINFFPSDIGLQYEDIFLNTFDGVKIHGWLIPAENAYATVLYFHGNAGNVSHRVEIARMFYDKGINFFIIDYRGFGKSAGTPAEKGTYLDGISAYNHLIEERKIPPEQIVIYGKSLGAAIAVDTAIKAKAGLLICESGFTSTKDMAKDIFKFIPLWLFTGQKYDTISKIDKVRIPKLIIHSQNDEIVPFNHGKRLFEKANEPKEFYVMRGGHNDAFYIYNKEAMEKIVNFLKKYLQ